MVKSIADIITIAIALAPVIYQLFALIAQRTHSQRLMNLSNRAAIIVSALEQTEASNIRKKKVAYEKLANYASEVHINVTADQLDDYIESAVRFIKVVQQQP